MQKNKTVIKPFTVYTNDEEKSRWGKVAYSEGKMLSRFVRDVVNAYIDEKQKNILWGRR